MGDYVEELQRLGLDVNQIEDRIYICRTKKHEIIVIYYNMDAIMERLLWHVEVPRANIRVFYFNTFNEAKNLVKDYLKKMEA